VELDSQGRSTVLLGTERNLTGLRDIACKPGRPLHILVTRGDFRIKAVGFLLLNPEGRILHRLPSGPPENTQIAVDYDDAGNLYTASGTTVFKNDVLLATLPFTSIGQLAVDSRGIVYVTDPHIASRVFRIDQTGSVTVFAGPSQGLSDPFGLAIDSNDNVFVANNPGAAAGFILRFDSSGVVSPFAAGISFQPGILSLAFDSADHLNAALRSDDQILRFDETGNSIVFADAADGIHHPGDIATGPLDRPFGVCR
jgi:hypothetical protein